MLLLAALMQQRLAVENMSGRAHAHASRAPLSVVTTH